MSQQPAPLQNGIRARRIEGFVLDLNSWRLRFALLTVLRPSR
jgi:hypothetical protein